MKRVFRVELNGDDADVAAVTCDAIEDWLADEKCAILFETVSVTEVKAKGAAAADSQSRGEAANADSQSRPTSGNRSTAERTVS